MTYITSEMLAFAEGYHAGRMEYDPEPTISLKAVYMAGYEAGKEDRSEQDERN